jgi:hypothetical protein
VTKLELRSIIEDALDKPNGAHALIGLLISVATRNAENAEQKPRDEDLARAWKAFRNSLHDAFSVATQVKVKPAGENATKTEPPTPRRRRTAKR